GGHIDNPARELHDTSHSHLHVLHQRVAKESVHCRQIPHQLNKADQDTQFALHGFLTMPNHHQDVCLYLLSSDNEILNFVITNEIIHSIHNKILHVSVQLLFDSMIRHLVGWEFCE